MCIHIHMYIIHIHTHHAFIHWYTHAYAGWVNLSTCYIFSVGLEGPGPFAHQECRRSLRCQHILAYGFLLALRGRAVAELLARELSTTKWKGQLLEGSPHVGSLSRPLVA